MIEKLTLPLQWFAKRKQEYLRKSPLEKWRYVRQFHSWLGSLVGCAFMDSDYKVTFKTLCPSVLLADYLILLVYTVNLYRNNLVRALMATPAVGIMGPAVIMYIFILMPSTCKQLRYLYNFGGNFIYSNSNSSPKINSICDHMAIKLLTKSIKVNSLILFALYLTCCVPLYNIFFNKSISKENQLIVPVIFPFLDIESEEGFYINIFNQLVICLVGVITIPSIGLGTSVIINNIEIAAELIANSLRDFERSIEIEDQFSKEYIWKFRNIILQMMDVDRFLSHFTQLFYWRLLIQPISLMYTIIVCIFAYVAASASAAIGCSVCCYIQLLILCDAGNSVDDANDTILDALNQFPFYLLSNEKQKLFALALKRNQSTSKLRIGPFAELNYQTASRLTRTMYTYTMYILRARG